MLLHLQGPEFGMGPVQVADAALHEDRIVPPAGSAALQPAGNPAEAEGTQILELLRKQAAQFRGSASERRLWGPSPG